MKAHHKGGPTWMEVDLSSAALMGLRGSPTFAVLWATLTICDPEFQLPSTCMW
jgi:hypothetical protein